MEQRHFFRTLRHFWLIPVLLLVASVAGVYVYNSALLEEEAQSTVGVLDPFVARPGYGQAQIGFDAVVRSRKLTERVAERIGRTPEWVGGHVSVAIVPALSGFSVSPLYAVRGKAPDQETARRLADIATAEARQLFIELNDPDPAAIREAFASVDAEHMAALQKTRAALDSFVALHDARDLPARIGKTRDAVSSLTVSVYQARAEQSASSVTDNSSAARITQRRIESLDESLTTQRRELDRLLSLEARYSELSYDVQIAQVRVTGLENLPEATRQSLERELRDRRAELEQARRDLTAFTKTNDAVDLPSRLAQARGGVAGLKAALDQARVDQDVVAVVDQSVAQRGASNRIASLTGALQGEQDTLDQLLALQTDYDELAFAVQVAQGQATQLDQLVEGLINAQRVPLAAQVRILDSAQIRSQFLWVLLTYSIGALAGIFLGASAVYLIALRWRAATTAEQVASAFGAPILVRIPSEGR